MKNQANLTASTFPEITFRGIILGVILAIVLAASNTFLALKIGFVTSASIPASIFAMGILRFFKKNNVLENNMVQTCASAGEAVAVGVVFTVPALIIIHYWTQFNYWENFAIAVSGGILGVLFTIPLRKVLVTSKELPFPEGNAIVHVLQVNSKKAVSLREMLLAGSVGGLLEIAQSGLKIIASSTQAFFLAGKTLIGFSVGFSATLIGAGYLIGFTVGFSLLIGAIIAWVVCVPLLSQFNEVSLHGATAVSDALALYGPKVRYIGIGAMLVAGLVTLASLVKPIAKSIQQSLLTFSRNNRKTITANTERDIPFNVMLIGLGLTLIFLYQLFSHIFNFEILPALSSFSHWLIMASIIYVLIMGFVLSTICAYFSGLVGVSVSPISSIIIMSVLLIGLILKTLLSHFSFELTQEQLVPVEAIAIVIGSVVIGAASITNDNIQDLKVGYEVGSTPWKQQIMLLVGVVASASVMPPILNLLFNAYGIAGVMPHTGMNPAYSFAAPPAAMMATVTQGVFSQDLPWHLFGIGAGIILFAATVNQVLKRHGKAISLLGIALGIYLPLAYSTPLFLGAFIAYIVKRSRKIKTEHVTEGQERGTLIACGLVAGAALMDIVLAIPMGLAHSPDVLNIMPTNLSYIATWLGSLSVVGLGVWFYRVSRVAK